MAKIFKFDRGCQLALNLDNLGAIDVSKVREKWCVRLFFTGGDGAYNLETEDKETADMLYEKITKAMED